MVTLLAPDVEKAKEAAALAACERLEDGMVVGLGTGSTATFAIKRVGELVADGMDLTGIPTSLETMELAKHLDVPLTTLDEVDGVDVTIDGADEATPDLDLIKGMGGALLREKIVASVTDLEVIVVDPSKVVDELGTRSPLPVEVVQFGRAAVERRLREEGFEFELRRHGEDRVLTDNGNLIIDLQVRGIDDPEGLEAELDRIPGVVENGLFLGLADVVIVGEEDGSTRTL